MRIRSAIRFSLASVLLAVTVAAIAFGYVRWRRQQTLNEYKELHSAGVGLIMVYSAPNWTTPFMDSDFWFRHPRTAEVYVLENSFDELRIGSKTYTWPQAQSRLNELKQQLYGLGVTDIQIWTYSAVPPLSFPPQVLEGIDPRKSMEQYREMARREGQVLQFGAENDMAGGGFSSADELQQRWGSLRPN